MKKDDITIVISLLALIISASVAIYDINENEGKKTENINILTSRYMADYPSKIIPVSFYQEQSAIIPVYFECILVNEGEKPVNIIDYSIRDISSNIISYTYMDMGGFDSSGNPLSFPINLQSKESKKFFMKVGLRMNSTVFDKIEAENLQSENTTINDINLYCTEKGYDIYGNAAKYDKFTGGEYHLSVIPERYQTFTIIFSTSNYNSFQDTFSWYKIYPQ